MFKTLATMAACLMLLLNGQPSYAGSQPLEFTHTVNFEGLKLDIPVQLWMTAQDDNKVDLKIAGNLKSVQTNLSKIFAGVVQDDCDRRIAFQVDDGKPEGNNIRMNGRVQVHIFRCSDPDDFDTRNQILTNIIEINALISSGVRNNCIEGKLDELTLDPSGLVGGILNLFSLTDNISSVVRDDINKLLNEKQNCFELPDVLQLLDAEIVSGGFRDFGNGNLGMVAKGTIDIRAPAVVDLLELAADKGILDE